MTPERVETRGQFSGRVLYWTAGFGALLVPLIAMQFTDEVAWTGYDFAAAAALVIGAGLAFELLARSSLERNLRIIFGCAIAGVAALLWAHGAIGVF